MVTASMLTNDSTVIVTECGDLQICCRGVYSGPGHIAIEVKLYPIKTNLKAAKKATSHLKVVSKRFGELELQVRSLRRLHSDTLACYSTFTPLKQSFSEYSHDSDDEFEIDLSAFCSVSVSTKLRVAMLIRKSDKSGNLLDHMQFYE